MIRLLVFPIHATWLALALFAAAPPANAAEHARPTPHRPGGASADALAGDFAAGLAAIMAAEIAAHDKMAADASNPFRKPRPRPDREYLMSPQANAPARCDAQS